MTFREHVERAASEVLGEFPAEGVYAVTFRIDSVDQDPRFPYVAVGYADEGVAARNAGRASDAWEARWSYAYFGPAGLEGVRIIGHDPENDPAGAELHRREAEEQGLWYDGEDEDTDERDERLDEWFHTLCVEVARHLHASGRIVAALGRPVPVILYDMFDPDAMFALTGAANPAELITEFAAGDPEA
ncbi:hypothetical protein [Spirillospora sp. NPDC047279]|uniref:hypothetical protein n=1 Tax=Spirillospora sp. NPDC047279 TaxID=3155478 RepID=UPI0033F32E73